MNILLVNVHLLSEACDFRPPRRKKAKQPESLMYYRWYDTQSQFYIKEPYCSKLFNNRPCSCEKANFLF